MNTSEIDVTPTLKGYTLEDDQFWRLVEISKPPYGINYPWAYDPTPKQANTNAVWKQIGAELGFQYMTARPFVNPGQAISERVFTAEATTATSKDPVVCVACNNIVDARNMGDAECFDCEAYDRLNTCHTTQKEDK